MVKRKTKSKKLLGVVDIEKKAEQEIKKISGKTLKKKIKKLNPKNIPTLQIKSERDIAEDFAQKVYEKFDALIKSIILFGSTIKNTNVSGSDIDIIIIIDDAAVNFDEKLIAWYREELGKIIQTNPYKRDLHINTVKLTTWWEDLRRGDPTVINIIRYGEAIIDYGSFFNPLKMLLQEGRIRPTPEAMYIILNRIPLHILRSKQSKLSAIEGIFWAFVETSQSLLMAVNVLPPSPEHIAILLRENLVDKKLLNMKYTIWFRDIYDLHRKIIHGEIKDIDGKIIDEWQERAQEFFEDALKTIDKLT